MAEIVRPLLGKLAVLMEDECAKLKGVEDHISFFKDELTAMNAALEELELRDELDPSTRDWRDRVREMAYDMEDCVDDFTRSLGGADADANAGIIHKITHFVQTLWTRHQIAGQFKELRARVMETNDRRKRYKLGDCKPSSRVVAIDPRLPAIYKEAAGLVGIDGPREKLVGWLTDTEEKLKVVSIVGFGGLGKTTLAKQVYDEIGGQFDCKAFVSVSQRPDMTSLLAVLQRELGIKEEERSRAPDVQDVIDRLREHLSHKRFLIVLDDLWDQSAWKIISCAFTKGGNGSKVIVTTRVDDVALWACHNDRECIYRMRPLEEQDSKKLFFNRVFGSEDGCLPQFKAVSAEILKKCGGLPLAIITIASLLASDQARSMNEWESIRNSLSTKFAAKPTLGEMRSILNLSYIHLPLHLRACLLYLGMYPEDRPILRSDLVQQWIAEGFVNHQHGSNLEDAANSYFNELINRSLIQPVSTYFGKVLYFRVHDMMLDLILSKCQEDNFISVAYNWEDMARLHGCEYKVRRLSLKTSADGETSGSIVSSLSQVRSFARFGESNYTPPLQMFKYLRVLVIEFADTSDKTVDLTSIGELFQLRYLKIEADSRSIELPNQIQGLVYLETLDLFCRSIPNIPSDIVLLPLLSCLALRCDRGLPEGIRNMKALRHLHCLNTGKSSLDDIKGIGELTNLIQLKLIWSLMLWSPHLVPSIDTAEGNMAMAGVFDALVPSIGKLGNLKHLFLSKPPQQYDDQLYSLSDPPLHIESLHLLEWPFKGVPKWIGDLRFLRGLTLCVEHLSTEEADVLGKLPSLVELYLKVLHIPEDNPVIICMGLFLFLDSLDLRSDDDVTVFMVFEAGAMSKLQRLGLQLGKKWGGATPIGMEHLSGLQQIYLHLLDTTDLRRRDDAETTFRNAAEVHPSHPSITIDNIRFGLL